MKAFVPPNTLRYSELRVLELTERDRAIYDFGDVVLAGFPFTNLQTTKKRPLFPPFPVLCAF